MFTGAALAAPAAHAQGSAAAAEALYREGQRLMEAGKVHDACIKFAGSQKLDPTTGTLINLANCHEKEGKTATAWAEFTEAAAAAGRAGQREREAFAREHASALEKLLRNVVIDIPQAPAGTEVKLDGQSFGVVALGTPIPVDPGEHELYVTAPKKKAWAQKVTFQPGPGTTRVPVPALQDVASEQPTEASVAVFPKEEIQADSDERSALQRRRNLGYIVGGAGILALGTGIVFGVRAKLFADKSDREQNRALDYIANGDAANAQVQHDAAVKDHDDAKSNQTIGIIAGAAGLVATGIGVYLVVSSKESHRGASSARVMPLLSPNTAGASAAFTF
ncbi:hypothetical protein [Pendulispora albinea]|uniref:PEGA domain-containing protein n=1 Tax=Pendulispora albinea TaxID=2741071 RepID=A0ABZ2LX41_9BACT